MPHAAGVMPQHGKGEIENAGSDTGAIHQNAGKDEKRHAQQAETINAIDQFGRGKITGTPAGHRKEQYGGDKKRPAHRHSGKHNNQPDNQRDINRAFAEFDILTNAQRVEPGRLDESHQKHRRGQNDINPNGNAAVALAVILLLCLQETEEHQDGTNRQGKIKPFIGNTERNQLVRSLGENGDAIIKQEQDGAENQQLRQTENPDPQCGGQMTGNEINQHMLLTADADRNTEHPDINEKQARCFLRPNERVMQYLAKENLRDQNDEYQQE